MKLDLGCGKHKKDGHIGVDSIAFDGVDVVCNIGADRWPFDDESVDEAHASHVVEHLTAGERIHFVNELARVLRRGSKATIVTPHWCSNRAYGDLTHQWPPVSEMWFFYLKREWREVNAPHNVEYTCDFDATWGYGVNPALHTRNAEYVQYALESFKESATDLIATITKR